MISIRINVVLNIFVQYTNNFNYWLISGVQLNVDTPTDSTLVNAGMKI